MKCLLAKAIVESCSFGNKTGKNESKRFVKVKLPQLGIAKLFVIFLRRQLLICSRLVFKAITDLRKLIIIHRMKKRKKNKRI